MRIFFPLSSAQVFNIGSVLPSRDTLLYVNFRNALCVATEKNKRLTVSLNEQY